MAEIDSLLDGFKLFHQKYFVEEPETYNKLVHDGQSPKFLIIACSDSRVDPSIVLDTKPGDIFVIRNVANLVPPYEHDEFQCHGTSAAIEYAVTQLHVEDIIVFGHSHCGGIKALIDDEENDHSFIDNWLYIANSAKDKAIKLHQDKEHICEFCEKEAIRVSLHNLLTFPFVQEAIANKRLEIHGWYFCIDNGTIEIIDKNAE